MFGKDLTRPENDVQGPRRFLRSLPLLSALLTAVHANIQASRINCLPASEADACGSGPMIAIGNSNTQQHRPHRFEPTNRTESVNQQKGYSHA
jgi:hypothetical protein